MAQQDDFIANVDRERSRRRLTQADIPLDAVALKPVASEVDTYVRAAPAQKSPLWEVATALQGLSGELDAYAAKKKKEGEDDDRAAGAAAFHQNRGVAYAEAVRQGLIPAFASQAFVRAYKEQQGDVAGRELATRLQTEYAQSGLGNSGDPAAASRFYAERTAQLLGQQNDPVVIGAMLPRIRQAQNTVEADHLKQTNEAHFTQVNANFQRQVNGILDDALAAGEDPAVTAAKLDGVKVRLSAVGVSASKLDEIMKNTIATKAEVSSNDGLLKLYDQRGADGSALGERLDVSVLRRETSEKIARKLLQNEELMHRREARAVRELEVATTTEAMRILQADPSAPIPPELIERGMKADPKFQITVDGLRKSLLDAKKVVDPQVETAAMLRIYEAGRSGGDAFQTMKQEIANGSIRDPNTAMKAWDDVTKMEAQVHSREGDVLKTPSASRSMQMFEQMLTPPSPLQLKGVGSSNPLHHTNTLELRKAHYDYQLLLLKWRRDNPNATAAQMEEKASDLFQQLTGWITDDKGQTWRPGDNTQTGKLRYRLNETPAYVNTGPQVQQRRGEMRDTFIPGAGGGGAVAQVVDRIIGAESQGDPAAQNKLSSAGGLGGFVDRTWASVIAKYRPDIAAGRTPEQLLADPQVMALKKDAAVAREMTTRLTTENAQALLGSGHPATAANLYLAHFAGAKGAAALLGADPKMDAAEVMASVGGPSAEVIRRQNPLIVGKTAGWLQQWASHKMGGAAAGGAVPAFPAGTPERDIGGLKVADLTASASSYRTPLPPMRGNPDSLIFHHTGGRGTAQGIVDVFRQRNFPAHFIMDRDGRVYQAIPDGYQGRHTRNDTTGIGVGNHNSIGIEIIAKDDADVTPAQRQAAVQWAKAMNARYGIQPHRMFGHGEVTPGHKQLTEGQQAAQAVRAAAKSGGFFSTRMADNS